MIAYCVSCRTVRPPRECSLLPEGIGCLKCGHYLLVLEGDFVTLSDQITIFSEQDDSMAIERSRGFTFSSNIMKADLLECEESLRLEPTNLDALMYLAKHSFSAFQYADAEYRFKQLESYYPDFLEVKQSLASVYLIVKKFDSALAVCEDIRKVDAHDVQAFFNLGLACYYSEKNFRALTVFQRILDKEKDVTMQRQAAVYVDDLLGRIEEK